VSKLLTADDILGADDLPRELVECPEWDGHVFIRTFQSTERDAWEQSIVSVSEGSSQANLENARANLVSRVACDEEGKALFTVQQIERLGQKSAKALGRCFDVASRLNGLSTDDMDEIVKNSSGDQSADSGSV